MRCLVLAEGWRLLQRDKRQRVSRETEVGSARQIGFLVMLPGQR